MFDDGMYVVGVFGDEVWEFVSKFVVGVVGC